MQLPALRSCSPPLPGGDCRGWPAAYTTHPELLRQVLQEPRVRPDASDVDAVGGVADEHLADEVHAVPGQLQVAGKAVLDAHDPLRQRQPGVSCAPRAAKAHHAACACGAAGPVKPAPARTPARPVSGQTCLADARLCCPALQQSSTRQATRCGRPAPAVGLHLDGLPEVPGVRGVLKGVGAHQHHVQGHPAGPHVGDLAVVLLPRQHLGGDVGRRAHRRLGLAVKDGRLRTQGPGGGRCRSAQQQAGGAGPGGCKQACVAAWPAAGPRAGTLL